MTHTVEDFKKIGLKDLADFDAIHQAQKTEELTYNNMKMLSESTSPRQLDELEVFLKSPYLVLNQDEKDGTDTIKVTPDMEVILNDFPRWPDGLILSEAEFKLIYALTKTGPATIAELMNILRFDVGQVGSRLREIGVIGLVRKEGSQSVFWDLSKEQVYQNLVTFRLDSADPFVEDYTRDRDVMNGWKRLEDFASSYNVDPEREFFDESSKTITHGELRLFILGSPSNDLEIDPVIFKRYLTFIERCITEPTKNSATIDVDKDHIVPSDKDSVAHSVQSFTLKTSERANLILRRAIVMLMKNTVASYKKHQVVKDYEVGFKIIVASVSVETTLDAFILEDVRPIDYRPHHDDDAPRKFHEPEYIDIVFEGRHVDDSDVEAIAIVNEILKKEAAAKLAEEAS